MEDQYQFILHHKVMEQLTDDQVPAVERQCERYLQAPAASPGLSAAQRLEIFARAVEPALQRELTTKGAASGDGSYAAELIGYVEIVSQIGL